MNSMTTLGNDGSLGLFTGVAELGGRLVVIGGNDGAAFLNSVECYDPLTDKWTVLPPMSRPRAGIGVAALDGLLYAVGGFDGVARLDLVEMFEPRMNAWTNVCPLSSSRDGVCVAAYGCWVYAVGGIDGPSYLNTVEAYDARTDKWEEMPPMANCRAAAGVGVLLPLSISWLHITIVWLHIKTMCWMDSLHCMWKAHFVITLHGFSFLLIVQCMLSSTKQWWCIVLVANETPSGLEVSFCVTIAHLLSWAAPKWGWITIWATP